MRTHLQQMAKRLLVPLILAACQETATDPKAGETADQANARPTISAATTAGAGRTTVFHFVANGDFGNATWFDEPTFGFIEVTRGGTPSRPEVFLTYEIAGCGGEFCHVGFSGAGQIPPGDLTGDGVKGLKLNTDTSNDPNFTVFLGTGGLISVEWDKSRPVFETRFSGTTQFKSPGFSSLSHGTHTERSARATGTVVGFVITEDGEIGTRSGLIGTNHNVQVEHTFTR